MVSHKKKINGIFLIIFIIISGVSSSSILLPIVKSTLPYNEVDIIYKNDLYSNSSRMIGNHIQNESYTKYLFEYGLNCEKIEDELKFYTFQFFNEQRFENNAFIENLLQDILNKKIVK